MKEGLPHLYGQKMYRWQRKFYESKRKYNTLVASNQSGKSAINIRKCIRWATDKDLWPKLWKKTPIQFWYLYPDYVTATSEFESKWVREFLPREDMKNHPVYGWTKKMRNGDIEYVRFNSGVTIYFKAYSQDVHSLQAGSCYAIFADEEVPWEIIPELQMRISATEGYMHFVFTATRGQEEWRRIIEERGKLEMWKEQEVDILKIQVSAYDCLYYEDGHPSEIWTVDKIEEAKRFLHTDAQIQRRIFGKFVKDEGLKYPCFNRQNNVCTYQEINFKEGMVYAGVDYGSGTNHQSSICLIWTNKDHTHGFVFDIWVGEKDIPTTAGDVVAKYKDMLKGHGIKEATRVFYDWASADLKTIANSSGLFFEHADKNHATGERILNTIFKNNMLQIMENGDWDTLAKQLESLTTDENKKYAWDDACFVAGTMIMTEKGEVPIEEITPGVMVATRNGLRPVIAATCRPAEVSEFTLQSGTKITCTPNHKFFTKENGFIQIRDLEVTDELLEITECEQWKQSPLTASPSDAIQRRDSSLIGATTVPAGATRERGFRRYIKKYGRQLMARSLKITMSTTSTATRLITHLRALNAYQERGISVSTLEKILKRTQTGLLSISKRLDQWQPSGTNQRMATDGMLSTARMSSTISASLPLRANSAQRSLSTLLGTLDSAQTTARPHPEDGTVWITSQNIARYVGVVSQRTDTPKRRHAPGYVPRPLDSKPLGIRHVYNITVDGDHEYFANGVLVANCDALRYSCTRIPWHYTILKDSPAPPVAPHDPRKRLQTTKPHPEQDNIYDEISEWDDLINFESSNPLSSF